VDPLLTNIGPILALVGALGAALFTYRASNRKLKSDGPHQMIDQLQEENRELRAERAKDATRISAVERTQRMQGDYIAVLRRSIADAGGTPPPWPDGLIT
jgi:hypothetical protein